MYDYYDTKYNKKRKLKKKRYRNKIDFICRLISRRFFNIILYGKNRQAPILRQTFLKKSCQTTLKNTDPQIFWP